MNPGQAFRNKCLYFWLHPHVFATFPDIDLVCSKIKNLGFGLQHSHLYSDKANRERLVVGARLIAICQHDQIGKATVHHVLNISCSKLLRQLDHLEREPKVVHIYSYMINIFYFLNLTVTPVT